MKYETYVEKYNETRDRGLSVVERKRRGGVLKSAIRRAVIKHLEKTDFFGGVSYKEWAVGWRSLAIEFTLSPRTNIVVKTYSDDFSFANGNRHDLLLKTTVTKRQIFG